LLFNRQLVLLAWLRRRLLLLDWLRASGIHLGVVVSHVVGGIDVAWGRMLGIRIQDGGASPSFILFKI
jgi:hypothetical protein